MLTDPSQVLALAGLSLPSGVTEVTVTSKDDLVREWGYYYAYTVSWHGSVDTTDAFLSQFGLPLSRFFPADRDEVTESLIMREVDVPSIVPGSRYHSKPFTPEHGAGEVMILLDGPDYTTAHVAVVAMHI